MYWLYTILIILFLYYTGLYTKLPDPVPNVFGVLDIFMPPLIGVSVNDDIEGIYESDFKSHGFKKYFMITKDITDDKKMILVQYRGSKSSTDDPVKLRNKEISDMKNNALDATYKHKVSVSVDGDKITIFDSDAVRKGTTLVFKKNGITKKYYKIQDV